MSVSGVLRHLYKCLTPSMRCAVAEMVPEGVSLEPLARQKARTVGAGQAGASHYFCGVLPCGKVSRYAYKH